MWEHLCHDRFMSTIHNYTETIWNINRKSHKISKCIFQEKKNCLSLNFPIIFLNKTSFFIFLFFIYLYNNLIPARLSLNRTHHLTNDRVFYIKVTFFPSNWNLRQQTPVFNCANECAARIQFTDKTRKT